MKPATLSELQKELKTVPAAELIAICIRLAKHKKENKELLNYLLFEARDEQAYIASVKKEMDELFFNINRSSSYTTKKGLQKIVRVINRYIKFSSQEQTELILRLYFCARVRAARISLHSSSVISNIYHREAAKAKKVFERLHEDLQFDYRDEMEELT